MTACGTLDYLAPEASPGSTVHGVLSRVIPQQHGSPWVTAEWVTTGRFACELKRQVLTGQYDECPSMFGAENPDICQWAKT